jgi:hypothetical protein
MVGFVIRARTLMGHTPILTDTGNNRHNYNMTLVMGNLSSGDLYLYDNELDTRDNESDFREWALNYLGLQNQLSFSTRE